MLSLHRSPGDNERAYLEVDSHQSSELAQLMIEVQKERLADIKYLKQFYQ